MNAIVRGCLTLLLVFAGLASAVAHDVENLKAEAAATMARFKRADPSLEKRLETAAGYALLAKVGKGGLVFGGASGNGVVYNGVEFLGTVRMSQVTFGAQIGGQVFAELILFEDAAALERFKESRFEMSAQASAVAAAEGVAENARYINGVAVFTMINSGLMAEASVGGQRFKFQPAPK